MRQICRFHWTSKGQQGSFHQHRDQDKTVVLGLDLGIGAQLLVTLLTPTVAVWVQL